MPNSKTTPLRDLRRLLRKDPKYKKFQRTVEVIAGRLKLEADRKEAWSMHASRTSRSLYGKDQFSLQKFEQAVLRDLSIRARMVEIRVQVSTNISMLERAITDMGNHIQTDYDDFLKPFKTIDRRKQAVSRLVQSSADLMADGEDLISSLDLFIKDLDQANFSLRHIVDTMKLLDSSKGKIL